MGAQNKPVIYLCDFDGTITSDNLADFLYLKFASCGSKYSDLWAEEKISTREEIELSFRHISASKQEMEFALSEIPIDSCFKNFIEFCRENEIEAAIISDGLEWAIRYVLEFNGIPTDLKIFANQVFFTKEGFSFNFPYFDNRNPLAGVYKPTILNQFKKQGYRVVLIGDGRTDMEAAMVADFVHARDELLIFCRKKGIPAHAYENFCEIIDYIKTTHN